MVSCPRAFTDHDDNLTTKDRTDIHRYFFCFSTTKRVPQERDGDRSFMELPSTGNVCQET